MNDVAVPRWTIDEIVIGSSAKNWLKAEKILPSTWGLQTGEEERIRGMGIHLTIMYSPASVLRLKPNPLKDVGVVNLIIVDVNALGNPKLSRKEKIAAVLHEIGHVFHELAPKKSTMDAIKTGKYVAEMNSKIESENAADDYVCRNGYGKYVASGLEKFVEINPDRFATKAVKARILRMKETAARGG